MIRHAIEYTDFVAKHSNDTKVQVGCTIFNAGTAENLSSGFNGNPVQLSQERDSMEPGKSGFLHAENRAVIACKADYSVKKEVYVNLPPCRNCCKILLELGGVVKVYYRDHPEYSKNGIELLQSIGISCETYE